MMGNPLVAGAKSAIGASRVLPAFPGVPHRLNIHKLAIDVKHRCARLSHCRDRETACSDARGNGGVACELSSSPCLPSQLWESGGARSWRVDASAIRPCALSPKAAVARMGTTAPASSYRARSSGRAARRTALPAHAVTTVAEGVAGPAPPDKRVLRATSAVTCAETAGLATRANARRTASPAYAATTVAEGVAGLAPPDKRVLRATSAVT
jgi:hypothetical protein